MKKKKLKKKLKKLKKKVEWYHKRMVSEILSTNIGEMVKNR